MKHLTKLLAFLLFAYLVASCALDNDKLETSITIEGIIQNTNGETLAGVNIELTTRLGKRLAQTNQSGKYIFENVTAGLGKINISYGDYYEITRNITIVNEKKSLQLDFVMRNFLDDYYLTVEPTSITLKNLDTQSVFKVESNAGFTVKSNADWLKASPSQSSSSTFITLSCEENDIPEKLEAVVTITGDYGKIIEVSVIQEPGPILKYLGDENSSYLLDANRNGAIFHFNRPVEVVRIVDANENTVSGITAEKLNDGKSISLKGFSQNIFNMQKYTLTVMASDGIEISTSFTLQCYLNYFTYNYTGRHFVFLPGDQYFWNTKDNSIYSLSPSEIIGNIPTNNNRNTVHYSQYHNSMLSFYMSNEKIYVEFYDAGTAEFQFKKEIKIDDPHWLGGIAIGANGIAVIQTSGWAIHTVDLTQPDFVITALPIEKLYSPDRREIPSGIHAVGENKFVFTYMSSLVVTIMDIRSLQMITLVRKRSELDAPILISRTLPYFAYYEDSNIHLVNTITGKVTKFPTEDSYGLRVMIEDKDKLRYIIIGIYHNYYLLDVETGKMEEFLVNNYPCEIHSSSYTGNYYIISQVDYSSYGKKHYLFEKEMIFPVKQ